MNRYVRFIVWLLCGGSSVLLFSYLELKLMAESKLVSDIIKKRTVKNSKVRGWLNGLGTSSSVNARKSSY